MLDFVALFDELFKRIAHHDTDIIWSLEHTIESTQLSLSFTWNSMLIWLWIRTWLITLKMAKNEFWNNMELIVYTKCSSAKWKQLFALSTQTDCGASGRSCIWHLIFHSKNGLTKHSMRDKLGCKSQDTTNNLKK